MRCENCTRLSGVVYAEVVIGVVAGNMLTNNKTANFFYYENIYWPCFAISLCAMLNVHPKRAAYETQQQAQMWLFVRVNFAIGGTANWHFPRKNIQFARENLRHM